MYQTQDKVKVGIFVSQAGLVVPGHLCKVCGEWNGQRIVTWFSQFCASVAAWSLWGGPQCLPALRPVFITLSPTEALVGLN